VHLNLEQELENGFDQILIKIKIIVGHVCRQHHESLALTPLVELLSVLIRNQAVLLAMHNEGRANYLRH